MSQNPTLVFDLDGTLADTIRDLAPALNRAIAAHGLAPLSTEQIGHVSGQGAKAMIKLAYKLHNQPLDAVTLEKLFTNFVADYSENLSVHTDFYPGAITSLRRFEKSGWHLAVCTNKHQNMAEKLLGELGARDMFTAITGGDSFDFKKPDPRHLLRTIEMAGGIASKAIMVGDTQTDILSAQNADVPVIAVEHGYSEHPVASYNPDRVIAGFDVLYDTACEMAEAWD